MARRARFEDAGAVHHVWGRGVEKRTIYLDDKDRRFYLQLLGAACQMWRWDCVEFCLLGNHFHLLIRTVDPTLSKGMHRIHTAYVMYFNEKYTRVGPLFQSRFGSARLWTCGRFDEAIDYIAHNPVAAGLCAEPEQWDWSAAAARRLRRPKWLADAARVDVIRREAYA